MNMFKVGQRVQCIHSGFNVNKGDKGTVLAEFGRIKLDSGYTGWWYHWRFEEIKEECSMKPGDTVRVKNCTGSTERFNGMIGKYLGSEGGRDGFNHQVSFVPTEESCGYVFADNELEVVPYVGTKVIVLDGSYSYEFVDGKVTHVYGEINKGIYKIIAVDLKLPTNRKEQSEAISSINDTIIRRISDGRVFFTQQRFLKEYVAFKRGDFVVYNDEYKRVSVVTYEGGEYMYGITNDVSRYNVNDYWTKVNEGELKEVTNGLQ